jgi:uncharacterized protein YlxP (DUF503 family)
MITDGAQAPATHPGRSGPRTIIAMWTGTLELDLLLGDVHSLKEKRSVVRPLVAELRRRFEVSAAEVGHLDVVEVLDAAERLAAYRPEVELLSARRRLTSSDDD